LKNKKMGYLKERLEFLTAEIKKLSLQQEIILERIIRQENHQKEDSSGNMMTQVEVCQEFNISNSTLRRWRMKGLPFMKVGNKIYYAKDDVSQWFKTNCRNSQSYV
jgi:hypothetical protein